MSRTTRKRYRYDNESDTHHLERETRDDKPRCDCCGNRHQKEANKRDRATVKRNLRNPSQ